MKKFVFVGFITLMSTFTVLNANYDKGYDAAWEGEDEPSSFWSTQSEQEGYEQGQEDAWLYDEGFYDGLNKKKPKHLNDSFYMDGFKDGKKDRK